MTKHEGSEGFIKMLSHEVAPTQHEEHPGLDALLDLSAGDVSARARSSLASHVATCETCRERWARLNVHLRDEEATLRSRARVPGFSEYVEQHLAREPRSAPSGVLRVFAAKPVLALAASAAVIALTLGISIPLVRSPAERTSQQVTLLTDEVQRLRNEMTLPSMSANTMVNTMSAERDLWADDLASWDWDHPRLYIVSNGDTWQTVAEKELGDRRFWSLLWLYNREVAPADAAPKSGTTIRLPVPYGQP
jgi:nucleoid-associated protein YgaU